MSGSVISWARCKSAPRSRHQHPTTQFFTGWMPFLPPNQQHHNTNSSNNNNNNDRLTAFDPGQPGSKFNPVILVISLIALTHYKMMCYKVHVTRSCLCVKQHQESQTQLHYRQMWSLLFCQTWVTYNLLFGVFV